MATSSFYGTKIKEASNEKEVQRRKEVDDLISKYGRKNKPEPVRPSSYMLQRDYSSSSLKFGSSRDNLYAPSGTSGIPAPTPHTITRRSSQYELPTITSNEVYEPMQTTTATSTGTAPRRYIASSKSSSNLYLNPNLGGSGYGSMDIGHGHGHGRGHGHGHGLMRGGPPLTNRQQKTLSMHEGASSSGRNNTVMETAASIIANAHQAGMGLGPADWWSSGTTGHSSYAAAAAPVPLQHDWSQKNVLNTFGGGSGIGGLPSASSHHHSHAPNLPVPYTLCIVTG